MRKKKYIQMREDIKETYKIEKELSKLKEGEENKNYSEEENVDAFMNDDSETLKKTIYKDFYKYLQNKPKIKIVDNTERDEKEEEFQKRVYDTIERQKEALSKFKLSKNKSDKKPVIQKPEITYEDIIKEGESIYPLLDDAEKKSFEINRVRNWCDVFYNIKSQKLKEEEI